MKIDQEMISLHFIPAIGKKDHCIDAYDDVVQELNGQSNSIASETRILKDREVLRGFLLSCIQLSCVFIECRILFF